MDENHQDKTESKLVMTENIRWSVNRKSKLWVPKHKKRTGFEDKTLWDWLQLLGVLAIPLILGIATLLFGIQQANLANQQHLQDQASALDQQQATILQTYLDNIQNLLLNYNLLKSKPDDDVAILARARTLTALQGLDPVRKGQLLTFLYEAKLIGFTDFNFKTHNSIIHLEGATLTHADLHDTILSGIDLRDAILTDADLTFANLEGADLTFANLRGSNLSNADLRGAILGFTGLTQQQIDQALSCRGAFLPPGLICHHNQ